VVNITARPQYFQKRNLVPIDLKTVRASGSAWAFLQKRNPLSLEGKTFNDGTLLDY
jgi:hypothetical protein